MRRESSTIVVLIGDADDGLLAGLARSPNISIAHAPTSDIARAAADTDARKLTTAHPGWEPGALAMREAARRRSTYVIVPDDPLADVASGWRTMWDVSSGPAGPDAFERSAAQALVAWRDKRFELPDYYLVTDALRADGTDAATLDMYLGPLRTLRPRRVAVPGVSAPGFADSAARVARIIEALRSLEHGPWWPPLDDLLTATRDFYAGGLAGAPLSERPQTR